jgi:hypothetical protein
MRTAVTASSSALSRRLHPLDVVGTITCLNPSYRAGYALALGPLAMAAPVVCLNIHRLGSELRSGGGSSQVPADTQNSSAKGVFAQNGGVDEAILSCLVPSAALAQSLFQGSPTSLHLRPTASRSKAAAHCSPPLLGAMLGSALSGLDDAEFRHVLKDLGYATNKVKGEWTGVSLARYIGLYAALRQGVMRAPTRPSPSTTSSGAGDTRSGLKSSTAERPLSQPNTAGDEDLLTVPLFLRFAWERSETRADLVDFLKSASRCCPQFLVSSFSEKDFLEVQEEAALNETKGGNAENWTWLLNAGATSDGVGTSLERNVFPSLADDAVARKVELAIAELFEIQCTRPCVRIRKQQYSPTAKPVSDCVEVTVREIVEYLASDLVARNREATTALTGAAHASTSTTAKTRLPVAAQASLPPLLTDLVARSESITQLEDELALSKDWFMLCHHPSYQQRCEYLLVDDHDHPLAVKERREHEKKKEVNTSKASPESVEKVGGASVARVPPPTNHKYELSPGIHNTAIIIEDLLRGGPQAHDQQNDENNAGVSTDSNNNNNNDDDDRKYFSFLEEPPYSFTVQEEFGLFRSLANEDPKRRETLVLKSPLLSKWIQVEFEYHYPTAKVIHRSKERTYLSQIRERLAQSLTESGKDKNSPPPLLGEAGAPANRQLSSFQFLFEAILLGDKLLQCAVADFRESVTTASTLRPVAAIVPPPVYALLAASYSTASTEWRPLEQTSFFGEGLIEERRQAEKLARGNVERALNFVLHLHRNADRSCAEQNELKLTASGTPSPEPVTTQTLAHLGQEELLRWICREAALTSSLSEVDLWLLFGRTNHAQRGRCLEYLQQLRGYSPEDPRTSLLHGTINLGGVRHAPKQAMRLALSKLVSPRGASEKN